MPGSDRSAARKASFVGRLLGPGATDSLAVARLMQPAAEHAKPEQAGTCKHEARRLWHEP